MFLCQDRAAGQQKGFLPAFRNHVYPGRSSSGFSPIKDHASVVDGLQRSVHHLTAGDPLCPTKTSAIFFATENVSA